MKAVLALSTTDFKRHKDVMGYCNKEYVAQNIFRKILNVQKGLPQNHQNRGLHGSPSITEARNEKRLNLALQII